MGLESGTYINSLNPSNPVGATDQKSQGDNHIRLIKSAILNTFANITGAVTATHTQLNLLSGITALASSDDVIDNFPSGTLMLFQQTAAPTGYTKQTTHNDKGLRVVSGTASSGGTDAFSTCFDAAKATEDHTLTVDEIPAHTHGLAQVSDTTKAGIYPNVTGGGSTVQSGSAGGGSAHSHNITIDLQYVDVIIASKD